MALLKGTREMVLGLLKPTLNPFLSPRASAAPPASAAAAAARTTASQGAAAQQESSQQNPPPAQTEGVTFDLSDQALQMVEAAAAQSSAAPAASPAPVAATEPRVATEAPAVLAPAATTPAAARAVKTSTASKAEPQAEPPSTTAAEPAAATDPSEEERARAWAIRGMERERLLNLVETLKVTPKADPAQKEVAEHTAAQPYVLAPPLPDQKGAA
jgi:hypothetical protein